MPVILATWEAEMGRIEVQDWAVQIVLKTPSPKITTAKWTEVVAQAVERLFYKHEALSSNPTPLKKVTFLLWSLLEVL
jgi:hypothetical protein